MTLKQLENLTSTGFYYDVSDQLKTFIYKCAEEAFAAGDAARDAIAGIGELEARNKLMREKFIESLGGLPPRSSPLNPAVTGIVQCDGYKIEKIIFESRPGVFVTSNLYLPNGIGSPQGAVLFLCGHMEEGKCSADHLFLCRYLVKAGLIVMIQDPEGQGERLGYYEKSTGGTTIQSNCFEHDYAGSQSWPLGDSAARYFVHDAMRGVDYLCTRPEVDPGKIGVTGYSGGGFQTGMMMVCDPRITAAAPATFIMNRRTYIYSGMAQDAEQIWPGMTKLGFDHEDILMAMAPRPVLVLAAKADFFPIEGTRSTVERTRRFWELYGKAGNIRLFEDECEHCYSFPMIKEAAEFFMLHLLGQKTSPSESEAAVQMEPLRARCTDTGQIRADFEYSRFIHNENVDRLKELVCKNNALPDGKRRKIALEWLRGRVFNGRRPVELNPRLYGKTQVGELIAENCIWWSQSGIFNYGIIFKDYRFTEDEDELPVTIAVWDGGTCRLQTHSGWIRSTCAEGRCVVVPDVSGMGKIAPYIPELGICSDPNDFMGFIPKLNHELIWLGDSLAALRTYDVTRAIDAVGALSVVRHLKKEDIMLYASGRCGMYAVLAAAIDGRLAGLQVGEEMESFAEWVGAKYYDHYDISSVIIPGVLQYFDLPDLKRWIAERVN